MYKMYNFVQIRRSYIIYQSYIIRRLYIIRVYCPSVVYWLCRGGAFLRLLGKMCNFAVNLMAV